VRDITKKVVRSVGVYRFLLVTGNVLHNAVIGIDKHLGGRLVGPSAIIALKWKKGIPTLSEVRYAVLDEDLHGSVIRRRPVPA
jgi:hypothetical protein